MNDCSAQKYINEEKNANFLKASTSTEEECMDTESNFASAITDQDSDMEVDDNYGLVDDCYSEDSNTQRNR